MLLIGLKESIGNAFIDYVEKTGIRRLSLEKITDYQNKIVNLLNKMGKNASIYSFNNEMKMFLLEYEDVFSYNEKTNYISLKDSIDTNFLRRRFRTLLSLELLEAFTNERIIDFLIK